MSWWESVASLPANLRFRVREANERKEEMGKRSEAKFVNEHVKPAAAKVAIYAGWMNQGVPLSPAQVVLVRGAARELKDIAARFAAIAGVEAAPAKDEEPDAGDE